MVMEAHPSHPLEGHAPHLEGHQPHHLEAHTLEAHQMEGHSMPETQQTPTPQCVGLEFVRQYYTILNKAPWHLHRFYATNSSFMHSGENSNRQAVIGQGNIHKCIMSLNFQDCHAKILLIDSQGTLADGIVIQVTGELSNRGSPMRRFMQTFVLAPQSEKKYYVHNDIFRYQDQVFNDDTGSQVDDGSDEVEAEDGPVEESQQPQQQTMAPVLAPEMVRATVTKQQQTAVAPPSVAPVAPAASNTVDYSAMAPPQQQQQQHSSVPAAVAPPRPNAAMQQQQQQQQQVHQATQQLNGGVTPPQQVSAPQQAPPTQRQHHHHQPPPPQPVVAPSPPQQQQQQTVAAPSTNTQTRPSPHPTAAPQHIPPRQVDSSIVSSGPQNREQEAWVETGDWNDNSGNDWLEPNPPSAAPPPQSGGSQQQTQHRGASQKSSGPAPSALQNKPTEKKHTNSSTSTQQHQAPSAPQHKSYAAVFKDSSSMSSSAPVAAVAPVQAAVPSQHTRDSGRSSQAQQPQPQQVSRDQQRGGGSGSVSGSDRDGGQGFQRAGRGGRPMGSNYRNRNNPNSYNSSVSESSEQQNNSEDMDNSGGYGGRGSEDRRRGPSLQSSVPDTQQIFVGNLPQSVKDEDLRKTFERYGTIVDVRINTGKGKMAGTANGAGGKGPANHVVPNFGFITFNDEQAVMKCLKARPITINEDHRLNVEEKKTKNKMDGSGGGYGGGGNRPAMRPSMGGRGGYNRLEGGRGGGGQRGGSYGGSNRR